MAFSPRLNSNGMANNPWWYSNGNIYYASGYGLPNCTCYAYGRYAEIRGEFAALPSGDGGQWYDAATGFNRGSTPKLGAIACYKSRSGQYAGHVAVVEVINDDGSIITSNSAYNGTYFFTNTVYASDGYVAGWMTTNRDYYCQGFIYNDAGGTQISDNAWVIAAICGVWFVESNCNPAVWESLTVKSWDYIYGTDGSNAGGYGLGQWTNTQNGSLVSYRLLDMYNWITGKNGSMEDGGMQLEYFIYENVWFNEAATIGDYTTLQEYLNSDSIAVLNLVIDFMLNWEGAPTQGTINWDTTGDPYGVQTRTDKAIEAYAYIQQHANDNPNDYEWIFGNRYLTNDEWLNNVMCIYFWLYSGGEPAKKKRTIINNPLFVANMRRKILIHRRF